MRDSGFDTMISPSPFPLDIYLPMNNTTKPGEILNQRGNSPQITPPICWYINRQEKLIVLGPPGNGDDDWQECCESACVAIGYHRGPCLTREAIGVLIGLKLSWLQWQISLDAPYCGNNLKPLSIGDAL